MPKRRRQRRPPGVIRERTLSVMVLHRTKDTMELVASVEANKASVAAAMAKKDEPLLLAGEDLPDWELMLTLTGRGVEAALGRLIEHDDTVDDAEIAHELLQLERKRLVREELYPRTVAVRSAIDLAFGREEGYHLHGMKGRIPRNMQPLERNLKLALNRLTNTKRTLPPKKNPYSVVDREGWVEQLRKPAHKLARLNRKLDEGEAVLGSLHIFKQMAMDAFDVVYGNALRTLGAAYRAAGFNAKMVRGLRAYYERRRLSLRARQRRTSRAAAVEQASRAAGSPPREKTARVVVPKTVVRWLEKARIYGPDEVGRAVRRHS